MALVARPCLDGAPLTVGAVQAVVSVQAVPDQITASSGDGLATVGARIGRRVIVFTLSGTGNQAVDLRVVHDTHLASLPCDMAVTAGPPIRVAATLVTGQVIVSTSGGACEDVGHHSSWTVPAAAAPAADAAVSRPVARQRRHRARTMSSVDITDEAGVPGLRRRQLGQVAARPPSAGALVPISRGSVRPSSSRLRAHAMLSPVAEHPGTPRRLVRPRPRRPGDAPDTVEANTTDSGRAWDDWVLCAFAPHPHQLVVMQRHRLGVFDTQQRRILHAWHLDEAPERTSTSNGTATRRDGAGGGSSEDASAVPTSSNDVDQAGSGGGGGSAAKLPGEWFTCMAVCQR